MLPRWYPNPIHPADGNFIEKHVLCIAKKFPVCVLFVKELDQITEPFIIDVKSDNHVEFKCYYKLNRGIFYWLINPIRYVQCQMKFYKIISKKYGKPKLTHVHILGRNALLALYLKLFNTPYVISEHWSGYYKESGKLTFLKKLFDKLILTWSSANSAVSNSLSSAMKNSLSIKNVDVIPNVVDEVFFSTNPSSEHLEIKKIVHISNLKNDVKQTDKILIALNDIANDRQDFELIIIGDGPDKNSLQNQARELSQLRNRILFTGDIDQKEIAEILSEASMTISYSKFETQSLVLLESLAMNIPIVAPNIGGIPEYAEQFTDLFEVNDLDQFKSRIIQTLDQSEDSKRLDSRSYISQNFSCNAVCDKFKEFYDKIN